MTRLLRPFDALFVLALSAMIAGCAPVTPSAHQYATPYQPPLA